MNRRNFDPKTRWCSKCEQQLDIECFYKSNSSWCKLCQIAYKKIWGVAYTPIANENSKKYRSRLRIELLNAYGNKCACCGETERAFLSLDHVYGGGLKHKRKYKEETGHVLTKDALCRLLKINNYPDSFQILCHNCNQAKGFHGECPHVTKKKEILSLLTLCCYHGAS